MHATTPSRGPAIVHLRIGTFVAENAELSHGVLTFSGRLRERDVAGVRLYQLRTRSHRLRAGEWVEWITETAEAVAA